MIQIDGSDGFPVVLSSIESLIETAPYVDQRRWQGMVVEGRPGGSRCRELLNVCFEVDLGGIEGLPHWRSEIRPNLPWADDHFAERVGGEPLNPGEEWRNWPWGRSADRFRTSAGVRFNHSYMERLWPRWAGMTEGGILSDDMKPALGEGRRGIRNRYGDLDDLVDLLVRDPWTRQAWIPLFHPEDTGWADGGRKPCTLGYQLMRRGDRLHIWYPLRSCDVAHHLRDDCYLAVRLLIWVIERCRERDPSGWFDTRPGTYAMHMTSLHLIGG